ncbi:lysozyme [Leifsonia sp. NPDC058292]|uniref:lysozyme n=1 Tax=Leifsonia sp. NPDC058292 TaxID=3346428 RepID=UPI0036DE6641
MPSLTRLAVASASGLVVIAAALTATAPATAETSPPVSGAGTAATATPTPTPTSTPTAAPTATPTPGPQAPTSQAPAASPTSGLTEDPPLAEMNKERNHSMGSTIAANEPGAVTPPGALSTKAAGRPPGVPGLDVSGWQVMNAGTWANVWANGGRFAYVKATEATDYVSSQFSEQYNDSFNAGLLHGAYHFATPNTSSGAAQANWFLNHGGQGTADGRTMPPLLDIEYNPYGATCYGMSQGAMVSWIQDFSNTIQARTGKLPAIYSTTNWWIQCTGNSSAFASHPLFIARYPNNIADGAGTLPAGWSAYTLWQFSSSGVFPGDQDVFNGSLSDLQTYGLGTSLARTVANATVYLISGSNKYPITNGTTLAALAPLGQVAYVSQSYLNSFSTQQVVGRIIRSPEGTISFFDSGIKLPFNSCGLVTDYGGSCDASGYVQLSSPQAARFVTGPAMTPFLNSRGGPLYYVQGGQRHEILDATSQQQAGLTGSFNTLSASALVHLSAGKPVVRDNVYAKRTGTSAGILITGGKVSTFDDNAATTIGLAAKAVGTLQPESIAQLPTGTPFTGSFQASGTSTVQVAASDGLHTWASGVGGASFKPVTVPSAMLSGWASKPAVQVGSAVMSTASGTVYLVMPSNIRPISSWDSLVALAGGKTPTITVVPQALIATLPKGPVALNSGTLVRNASNATVYLVNGVTNKIPFSTFGPPNEAGFTQFTYTTDDRLAGYPTSTTLLGFGVICGTQKYVSAGGSIHAVSSSLLAQYPFTYVQLDSFTCGLVKKGIDATAFIRTPDGSIYYLSGGQKHPINSMARFEQLSAGKPYLNVVAALAATMKTGPAA